MKTLVVILYLCILVLVALISHTIGQGNPQIIFVDITAEILEAGFELHGLNECILRRGENGNPPHLYYYEGMVKIPNPNRKRAYLFLSNSLRNKIASDWYKIEED